MTEVTRTPKTWATTDLIGAADLNKDAKGMVGWEDWTADQVFSGTATPASITTVPIAAGRLYKITVEPGQSCSTSATTTWEIRILIDGTQRHTKSIYIAGTGITVPLFSVSRIWPVTSGSSMTVAVQFVNITAGTVTASASATSPGLLLVEDIGPSS